MSMPSLTETLDPDERKSKEVILSEINYKEVEVQEGIDICKKQMRTELFLFTINFIAVVWNIFFRFNGFP
jgi:hypothetical protein